MKIKAAGMNKIIVGYFEEWEKSPRIQALNRVKETDEKLYDC